VYKGFTTDQWARNTSAIPEHPARTRLAPRFPRAPSTDAVAGKGSSRTPRLAACSNGNSRREEALNHGWFPKVLSLLTGVLPKSHCAREGRASTPCAPPEITKTLAFRASQDVRGAHGVLALPRKPLGQHALTSAATQERVPFWAGNRVTRQELSCGVVAADARSTVSTQSPGRPRYSATKE
jgi:hypothetical protein